MLGTLFGPNKRRIRAPPVSSPMAQTSGLHFAGRLLIAVGIMIFNHAQEYIGQRQGCQSSTLSARLCPHSQRKPLLTKSVWHCKHWATVLE